MNKSFPILYSTTTAGRLQVWSMEQQGNKYRTTAGLDDGKKVTTAWTEAEAKNIGRANATTPTEQATAEIEACYKYQLKRGYYKTAHEATHIERFEPLLAKHYEDYQDEIDWDETVGVQIKYNGGCIIAKAEGLFTRQGERYVSIPHIHDALIGFFKRHPDAILHGEGFNYDLRQKLNEQMSLLRKTVNITPEVLAESKKVINFYIYDGYTNATCEKLGYQIRKEELDRSLNYGGCIKHVPTWYVHSKMELEDLYKKFLSDGHEGAIIRQLGYPYHHGRHKQLLKYKPMDDAEFMVVDIETGTGNWGEVAKRIQCYDHRNGEKFWATFKGTMEQAADCLKRRKAIIGTQVTIYYFGKTGLGTPNFAQFDWNNYNKQ